MLRLILCRFTMFSIKVDAMSLEEIECMLKETKERKAQVLFGLDLSLLAL